MLRGYVFIPPERVLLIEDMPLVFFISRGLCVARSTVKGIPEPRSVGRVIVWTHAFFVYLCWNVLGRGL